MATGGDGRADVAIRELYYFFRFGGEQFFQQSIAAGDAKLLGQHAQRVLAGNKMHAGHALVRIKRAQRLAGQNGA